MKFKLTVNIEGETVGDLTRALLEVNRKVGEGYLAGHDSNDTGNYNFDIPQGELVFEPPPRRIKMASRWIYRWEVGSHTAPDRMSEVGKLYVVAVDRNGIYGCTCPAWRFQREKLENGVCKHIEEVLTHPISTACRKMGSRGGHGGESRRSGIGGRRRK